MKIMTIRMANHPLYPTLPLSQCIIITSIAFCQPLSMHNLQNTFTKVKKENHRLGTTTGQRGII